MYMYVGKRVSLGFKGWCRLHTKGPVINYLGRSTKRKGWGKSCFTPTKRGGRKSFSLAEWAGGGGHKKCEVSFNMGHLICSHTGWGGHKKFSPL